MTDEELLNVAIRGGEVAWQELQRRCRERAMAERLAKVLEQGATQAIDEACAWASVLEDLHPGLKVNVPPAGSS